MKDSSKNNSKVVAKSGWNRDIFWGWNMDREKVLTDANSYDSLKPKDSPRVVAVLVLLFVVFGSVIVSYLNWIQWILTFGYLDLIVFSILAFFIYKGHRWAMLLAMVLFTVEKALNMVWLISTGNAAVSIGILLIWLECLNFLVAAFRVENARRKLTKVSQGS